MSQIWNFQKHRIETTVRFENSNSRVNDRKLVTGYYAEFFYRKYSVKFVCRKYFPNKVDFDCEFKFGLKPSNYIKF